MSEVFEGKPLPTFEREEQLLREAAAGLNVAYLVTLTADGKGKVYVADGRGRTMQMTMQLVREARPGALHLLLAAFADGVVEMRWENGKSTLLSHEQPIAMESGGART